jgi:membrane-bound lytic murein transglycosylase B
MKPLDPKGARAPRKEMGEIDSERREGLLARAASAFLRACFVAVIASSLGLPADAAASKRAVHARERAFQQFVAARERAFELFIAALWPLAEQRGVSRATFDRAFAGVFFDPKVVAMTGAQPEFVLPIWDYVAAAVSAERIERGRKKADAEGVWLAKANEAYGVDGSIILGVWGLETDFGGFAGSNNVIRALATLAYVHFRGDYFRDELLSALVILEERDIAPAMMRGSWAGAMGQMQFMPSSYLAYALDFEGHGRRDIWMSDADAIGSTANYLAKHGWTAGLPWGFEVRLPSDFVLSDADSSSPAAFSAFAARGVERADGSPLPDSGEGRLLILAGLKGPVFLVTGNFDVVKAYNNSTAYALSVGLLGDAITGSENSLAPWPIHDRTPTQDEIRRLQAKLKQMGYTVGEIDGMIGDDLRSAVRAFQERNGLAPDGYPDSALLERVAAAQCSFSTDGLKPPLKETDRPLWRCTSAEALP